MVEALGKVPDLARLWALKEGLRAVYKKRCPEDAAAALEHWISPDQWTRMRWESRTQEG